MKIKCIPSTNDLEFGFEINKLGSNDITSSSYTYKSIKNSRTQISVTNSKKYGKIAAKSIPAILMPLSNDGELFIPWKHAIYFKICPITLNDNVYLINKYTNEIDGLKGEKFSSNTRCSFAFCQIGLYFFDGTSKSSRKLDDYEYPFFVGFKTDSINQTIYLKISSYGTNNYPLFACPYYGWINEISMTKFEPNSNIIDNGLVNDKKDFRHIYIPILPLMENDEHFICGKIFQPGNLGSVSVGFKLKKIEDDIMSVFSLGINGGRVTCGSYTIKSEYTWSYSPPNLNYNSSLQSMTYMGKNIQLYSGQYLYYYEFEKNHGMYEEGRKLGIYNDENLENAFDSHKPFCVGKIEDVPAKLRLKYNDKFVSLNTKKFDHSDEVFNYYILQENIKTEKMNITCVIELDTHLDMMYDNFYNYRYKPIFVKGKISDSIKKSIKIDTIDFSSNILEAYGFYSCILDDSMTNKLIKPLELLVLPQKEIIVKNNIKYSADNNTNFSCNKIILDHINLNQIIVIYDDGINIYYTEKRELFEDKDNLVVFKGIFDGKSDKVTIKCIYKISQINFATIENIIQLKETNHKNETFDNSISKKINSEENHSVKSSQNDQAVVIIIIILLIAFLLSTIIIIVLNIRKSKNKTAVTKEMNLSKKSEGKPLRSTLSKPKVSNIKAVKKSIVPSVKKPGLRIKISTVVPSLNPDEEKKISYF